MIFNSFTYLVFLAVVVVLYWRLPDRPRHGMLLAASLAFYGFWRWDFVLLLLGSVVLDYCVGRGIEASRSQRGRRGWLMLSILGNLSVLGAFKYTGFFVDTVTGLGALAGWEAMPRTWSIILPLGVSFYTFQTLSYSVDVYRRFIPAQRDFLLFANYVVLFPQLVAGPILRAVEVIPQLARRPAFRSEDMAVGIRRILAGLFLKVVLADNLAPLVDAGFSQAKAGTLAALDVWTLAFLFGFQIYFDFAGYSHIALGSARLLGLHFPENFRFPYLAANPREFWRRWHISLSSWVRDYLYLPLCGAKVRDRSTDGLATASETPAGGRMMMALWVSWALMGLWHGANWTFVLWGLWHAGLVTAHRLLQTALPDGRSSVWRWAGWAVTLPLVMLGWIPFRADSLSLTLMLWSEVLDPLSYVNLSAPAMGGLIPQPMLNLARDSYLAVAGLLMAMTGARLAQGLIPLVRRHAASHLLVETGVWAACIALVFVYLRPIQQFIYFQF